MNFKLTNRYKLLFLALLMYCLSANAQNDVAIISSSNISVTSIGEEFSFNVTVNNVDNTNIEMLKIQIDFPAALDFINSNVPMGTVFSENTREWDVANQLTVGTTALNLELTFRPNAEGTYFITSELIEMAGYDVNSTAQNGNYLEDDISVSCITVPIILGQNDTVQLTAPVQLTSGHEWYQTVNSGQQLISQDALFTTTTPGNYSYQNTSYDCQTNACCEFILLREPEPCSITPFLNTICNNNATLADTNDDTFELDVSAIAGGEGFSDRYSVIYDGTILNSDGTNYGEVVRVGHPDFSADGVSIFNLIIQDTGDPDCQTQISVPAPSECSTDNCELHVSLQENNCCTECRDGNLKIGTTYWREGFKELVSANLARSKPSDFNRSPFDNHTSSFNATDGLYEGEMFGGFDYAFSKAGNYNFWELDMVGFYDLEEIRIFTQEDCCGGDATNYRIFISYEPFTTTDFNTLLNDSSIENYSVSLTGTNAPSIVTDLNINARFVRVYLEGAGQMKLTEVELIGSGNENSSPYVYSWNDISIGEISAPQCLSPGLYIVTVTDKSTGCAETVSISVD